MSLDSLYTAVYAARSTLSGPTIPAPASGTGGANPGSLAAQVYAARRDDVARLLSWGETLPRSARR